MRGASRRGVPFSINFERVVLSRETVEGVITCVQDFVRDRLFTQQSFFDSGEAMLKDAVAVADSVIVSDEFNQRSVFGDGWNQQVVSDLQPCQEKAVMRRKASRDTNERCFGAQSAGLPSASTSAGRGAVRILNVVEEGPVKYVAVPEPNAISSHSVKIPVIGSKTKTSASSGPMSRKHSEVDSRVTSPRKSYMDDSSFGAALDREALGLVAGMIVGHLFSFFSQK